MRFGDLKKAEAKEADAQGEGLATKRPQRTDAQGEGLATQRHPCFMCAPAP